MPELIPFADAGRKLARLDPRLKALIAHVGPCTLRPHPNAFRVLASSIVSQQISTKAAASISARVRSLCGPGGVRPKRIAELPDEALRGAGLSTNKLLSMRSLSQFFLDNASVVRRLKAMPDEEVIEALLPIRGVGVWTAQMFLIFCLGRPDVLPTADYGFQAGVRDVYGLDEIPKAKALEVMAEPWRPLRTVATWYFWRSRGSIPRAD
ncbi:MAG: DNA-3-methyladenine glycosylase 2 family protein [Zavarzinella sp.]|nr:DNA-3-methyladenine glycosylase 2 family protein [Zavarzinella sp.]